jgi:ElaB/YqjD/DUF883 family membrane-anchored ribosome-binding protein
MDIPSYTSEHAVTDTLADQAHETVDEAAERARSAEEQISSAAESLRAYVRENPLTAAGIAVATGFVMALLLRR